MNNKRFCKININKLINIKQRKLVNNKDNINNSLLNIIYDYTTRNNVPFYLKLNKW